jgi:hypothetical protein
MGGKNCIGCGVILDQSNTTWYRKKNYIYKCTTCLNIDKKRQARAYRSTDIGRTRTAIVSMKSKDRLKKNNPIKYTCMQMASSAKKRSKALMLEYDVSPSYLIGIAPVLCPVLNDYIKYGGGTKTKMSASLDRIDPKKGYVKDNVQIICNLANMMKNEATSEELRLFSNWALRSLRTVEKIQGKTK